MQKRLLKMCLSFTLDGKLKLTKDTYVDNVPSDGKVYQEKGSKSEHRVVNEGQMWVVYDDTIEKPYWNANVILDANSDEAVLTNLVMSMSQAIERIASGSLNKFYKNLSEARINSVEKANAIIRGNDDDEFKRKYVCIEKNGFINDIYWQAVKKGNEWCESKGIDKSEWEKFYKNSVNTSLIEGIMNALSVFHIDGDIVKFENNEALTKAKDILILKIASDSFLRFNEEMNGNDR